MSVRGREAALWVAWVVVVGWAIALASGFAWWAVTQFEESPEPRQIATLLVISVVAAIPVVACGQPILRGMTAVATRIAKLGRWFDTHSMLSLAVGALVIGLFQVITSRDVTLGVLTAVAWGCFGWFMTRRDRHRSDASAAK